jgi:hypothetical protein
MLQKLNQKQVHPCKIDCPNVPCDTPVEATPAAMPLLTPDAENCVSANMVYSRVERLFSLHHNFASKSFAAVRETLSNAYPDKELSNKK